LGAGGVHRGQGGIDDLHRALRAVGARDVQVLDEYGVGVVGAGGVDVQAGAGGGAADLQVLPGLDRGQGDPVVVDLGVDAGLVELLVDRLGQRLGGVAGRALGVDVGDGHAVDRQAADVHVGDGAGRVGGELGAAQGLRLGVDDAVDADGLPGVGA